MRTKHTTKSRSTSKRHRSLRKKSGGGISDWFNSTPAADDSKPWHQKASEYLTNLFSSAPPVPQNAPPPPRPGQPPAPAPVPAPQAQAPQAQATAPQAQATGPQAPTPGPGPAAPPKFGSDNDQFGSENDDQFGSSSGNNVAFGGRRTKKRRGNKNKNKNKKK